MIPLLLWDLRWRVAAVGLIAVIFYFLEPGFHQHESFDAGAVALGPLGISATLANLAALSMIVLLAGGASADRREGYSRLLFSQPTSPLAYYGLRWGLAFALSFAVAVAFLIVGQVIAWGEYLGGWEGLILPILSALVYGGLIAFFSVVLPRGDAWAVFLLLLPTFVPDLLRFGLASAPPALRQLINFILPPQTALQDVWEGLLLEAFAWGGVAVAAVYGLAFLTAAGLILAIREWP